MALNYQTVDVKFTAGLDTKTQAKLVIPGKWKQLINCTLSTDNTPTRRDGIAVLVAAASSNGLAVHKNELLTISGPTVSSISTGGTDQAKAVSGKIGFVGVSKQEIRRSTGMQDSCDVATGSGYTCYVWREKTAAAVVTGVRCSLLDQVTGTPLVADFALHTNAAAFGPRVVHCEATQGEPACFFIFYIRGTSLYCRTIRVTTPTVVDAEVALITSGSLAGLSFDACRYGSDGSTANSTAMVTYGWADGVTSLRTIQVTQTAGVPGILAGPTDLFLEANMPIASLSAVACAVFSNGLAGAFVFSSGANPFSGTAGVTIDVNWNVITPSALLLPNPPPVAGNCHITAVAIGVRMQLFTDCRSSWATAAIDPITTVIVNSTLSIFSGPGTVVRSASFAGAATDPAGPSGPWIAGKAFVTGTSVFLPVEVLENYQGLAATKASNNEQNTFFLLDCTGAAGGTTAVVVAKALYGGVGVATINNNAPGVSTPCSTPALSTGGNLYATTERTLLSLVGGFNFSPCGVVALTLTPNTTVPPIRAEFGEATYFAGGQLAAYDGLGIAESVFPLFPEGINVEVVVGGGAMTAGVHQVVVVAEWVDNAGQRKQSAPSLPVSATTAANDRLRVRVPSLLLGQMSGVTLVAYITQAAGLTFNRVATVAAGSGGTPNDPTLAFTTLALITAADTAYAGNELLYAQPNIAGTTLPNLAPGPCSVLGVHQNRLWFDKADQPGQFGFSQEYVNNLGLQFNEQLGGTVDTGAGPFRGFQSMDEKQIIFCGNKLFVLYGSGPNAAGGFSNYSKAQPIPSDVGCSEARSILEMPQGIIFKSLKGWYLLTRGLQVRYIGEGVAAYDANTVCAAVLLKTKHECRFSSESGVQLIYSYDDKGEAEGQWSTTEYVYGGIMPVSYLVADAIWWSTSGAYVTVSRTQGLNQDTPGVFIDFPSVLGGAPITTTATTAWLRLAIINGFQRVRKMFLTGTCPRNPAGGLSVTVNFDDQYNFFAPNYQLSVTYGLMFPTFNVGTPVDIRHHLQHQKCKAVSFTFVDVPTADELGNFPGVNFQALSLELGMKRGLKKLPAAQST